MPHSALTMVAPDRLLEIHPKTTPWRGTKRDPPRTHPAHTPDDDLRPLGEGDGVERAPRFATAVRADTLHLF